MIIITGDIVTKTGCFDEALELSNKHVQHSRAEPGCISHGVYIDPHFPLRLFFYEQWQDKAAIDVHFAAASSQEFVKNIGKLISQAPNLDIYRAQKLTP
jgi:quinol monooxygenase YgiN